MTTLLAGKFDRHPKVTYINRWQVRLEEDLQWYHPLFGTRTVNAGFVSDLASIRILRTICVSVFLAATALAYLADALNFHDTWLSQTLYVAGVVVLALYAILAGYGMRAAILHDWEYTYQYYNRKQCDSLFYYALRSGDGVARWRAFIFWVGVRIGGWRAWSRPQE